MFALLLACSDDTLESGAFELTFDRDAGTFSVAGPGGARLDDVALLTGDGEATFEMQFGAFRLTGESLDLAAAGGFGKRHGRGAAQLVEVRDRAGGGLGDLVVTGSGDVLRLDWAPSGPHDRAGFEAGCDPDDHFLGLGSHVDVDHVGEAFPLWTSEPGIGKSDRDDVLPDDWPVGGTKHATSFPHPFVLRPHHPDGLLLDTRARVDADLCAADPDRFRMVAWEEGPVSALFLAGRTPLGTVRTLTDLVGRQPAPPGWVFGAWADAIRGPDRVREVHAELRDARVPATVVWTEDWKGGNDTATGYRLSESWFLDRELYPDAEALDQELAADGIRWLAYFAPFVAEGDETWASALAADALVERDDGTPYTFTGVTFAQVGLVDVSTSVGRDWAVAQMQAALDVGFDGWMLDYGEWLPTDAAMANGATGLEAHASYPQEWQETSLEAIAPADATFFARSGWVGTPALAPVVWAGDQRTSFDADDGFPTVVPLGLGASVAGVPVFTHDVAGYQSVGNEPSDRELWFRWCALGAFTPVLRTHHGSFESENHQFDSDPETLAHFARMAQEHARLYPYLRGLAARAADDGTPMVLPVSFLHGDDWGRSDAWMLGDALLVAPVLERGVVGRQVDLPANVAWTDWWTLAPAESGFHEAGLEEIPVFAAAGTTVPTLGTLPYVGGPTFDDVDGERVVYVFGGGGTFTEADGTTYRTTGSPTGPGEVTVTFAAGQVAVVGVSVEVDGPVERAYTFVVSP